MAEIGVPVSVHVMDVQSSIRSRHLRPLWSGKHGRATTSYQQCGGRAIGTSIDLDRGFRGADGDQFLGVVYCTKVFLPILQEQTNAHIVNVSSVFGLIAPAEQSAYCSAKFAVRGFTESLRHELAETNISVSCVHPGGIKTNIVKNSRLGADAPEEWKQQGTKLFEKIATLPERPTR